ncbi:MAG: glycosyltransferase [Burkholderiales bacterium]|nr:glycosyltransferase [Burkholderiales bacterium]
MTPRIAVVTPYHRESAQVLGRCIDSVRAQSLQADHILVADGAPQDWVETRAGVQHVVVRRNSADFGDTPRSLGFMLGVRGDYDLLQFLDADNILLPGHFDAVLQMLRTTSADVLIARRRLLRPDGTELKVRLEEDWTLAHVDTSCFVFRRRAFALGLKWGFIPRPLGFCDDRVFYAMLRAANLAAAVLPRPSVGYTCMWPAVYHALGETPPQGCHDLSPYREQAQTWLRGLRPEERRRIEETLGIALSDIEHFSWMPPVAPD